MRREIDTALAMHAGGSARVLPILVGPFDWERSPVRGLAPLPSNGVPVVRWPDREEAWIDVVSAIIRAGDQLDARPAPVKREKQPLETLAALLAADAGANHALGAPALLEGQVAPTVEARWETWLFDRCSARDTAAIERLASLVSSHELAARLRDVAASIAAGQWPQSMAQTLVHMERARAGWRVDVRFSFLGHMCSVELTRPTRAPIGLGAALEAEPREGSCVVRLVAKRDSPVRGSRARIWDGAHALTRWLLPSGGDALGPSEEGESVLFEISTQEEQMT